MKFEELTNIWNSADLQLDKSVQLNRQLVKEVGLAKIKSGLYEIKWTSIIELVAESIFLILLTGFILNNFIDFRFSLPAMVLFSLTTFSILFEIYRLRLYLTIDSNSPVVENQKKLTRLRYLELLDRNTLIVIIPMFAAPFLVVAAKGLLNIDLYTIGVTWLLQFTVGSFVVAIIIAVILKLFPNKNLVESIAFLDELKENEETA